MKFWPQITDRHGLRMRWGDVEGFWSSSTGVKWSCQSHIHTDMTHSQKIPSYSFKVSAYFKKLWHEESCYRDTSCGSEKNSHEIEYIYSSLPTHLILCTTDLDMIYIQKKAPGTITVMFGAEVELDVQWVTRSWFWKKRATVNIPITHPLIFYLPIPPTT